MAKELPYFKFEPSAWDTGKIQIVDFELQGIFVNLCSFYWQRLGYLPYKLALQKICNGNTIALQKLCDEEVIEIRNDNISIKFLDQQLSEFECISEINKKNALKRWKNKGNEKKKRSQCDRNAIREEKIREEKSINIKSEKSDFIDSIIKSFQKLFKENRDLNYEITNKGKERSCAAKILKIYKNKFPEKKSNEVIEDLEIYFSMCLEINDEWLNQNMGLPLIINKFNQINNILKNGSNWRKKISATTDRQIADLLINKFGG